MKIKDPGVEIRILEQALINNKFLSYSSRDGSGVTSGVAFVPVILTSQILSILKTMPPYRSCT